MVEKLEKGRIKVTVKGKDYYMKQFKTGDIISYMELATQMNLDDSTIFTMRSLDMGSEFSDIQFLNSKASITDRLKDSLITLYDLDMSKERWNNILIENEETDTFTLTYEDYKFELEELTCEQKDRAEKRGKLGLVVDTVKSPKMTIEELGEYPASVGFQLIYAVSKIYGELDFLE